MEASFSPSCSGRAPACPLPAPRTWAPFAPAGRRRSAPCGCRRRLALRAVTEQGELSPAGRRTEAKDVFRDAAHRLNSLLSGVGDGTEELEDLAMEEMSPEFKAAMAAVAGAVVASAAWLFCWLIRADPLGGASLSEASLQHAALGLAVGAPAGALKLAARSPAALRAVPLLADVHEAEGRRMRPLLAGMTPLQVAAVACSEVGSSVLLLFPALGGGIQQALGLYAARLRDLGWAPPEGAGGWAGLALLAAVTGFARSVDHRPAEAQVEVVAEAVANADRFYRVVGTGPAARAPEAARAAAAFKITAAAWLQQHARAGMLSGALTAGETFFLGALWLATGDLAAPLAAALLLYGADVSGIYASLPPSQRAQ